MPDLLVRDLDEQTLELLKARSRRCGRSLQSEMKLILEAAARASDDQAARALADRVFAALSDQPHPDSAALIREDRER